MNNPELGNPTFLAFNVLAQTTQSREPSPTSRGRADVNPVLMGRASKMLIQCYQRVVVAMTQVAFICLAVPGPAAGIILGIVARSAAGEKTGRIGNYVVCVVLTNDPVDGDTVHSRSTFTSFKVKDERRARDKFHATPIEWTSNILWTMNRRPEVILKIALGSEIPLAGRAIVVKARLTIVLMQTIFVGKGPLTR